MLLHDLLTDRYLVHFLSSPSAVATFVALGLVAVVVALAARRRRLLVLTTGLAAAAVGGFTLAPARGWTTLALLPQPLGAVRDALRPSVDDLGGWAVADGPANVALFVPLAVCAGLLLRRPLGAFVVCLVLSVLVESYQAATGTRVGTFTDVVSNGVGALLGSLLSALVLVVVDLFSTGPDGSTAGPGSRRSGAGMATTRP